MLTVPQWSIYTDWEVLKAKISLVLNVQGQINWLIYFAKIICKLNNNYNKNKHVNMLIKYQEFKWGCIVVQRFLKSKQRFKSAVIYWFQQNYDITLETGNGKKKVVVMHCLMLWLLLELFFGGEIQKIFIKNWPNFVCHLSYLVLTSCL